MSTSPGGLLATLRSRGGASTVDVQRQLLWFAWLRILVVTTALFTTLLLDFVLRLDGLAAVRTEPLYAVLAAAYVLAFLHLGVRRLIAQTRVLAALQFGGDLLIETALLLVLGHETAVAFALALFFLSTFLACTFLGRRGRLVFATFGFLLQVVVLAACARNALPMETMTSEPTYPPVAGGAQTQLLQVFTFMFTFYGTAWLVGSRVERLRTMGDRLRRVSADLADLQAFNELVVRGMAAGLITADPAGRVTFLNPAALALFSVPAEELRGRPMGEVLGWADLEVEVIQPLVAGRTVVRFTRDVEASGRRLSLDMKASRLEDREGELLGLLFLLEDVTEVRALENEVRLKDRMAAIGEMAAGIAHEIRNPLASISGSVQMLQRQVVLAEEQRQLMDIVLKESGRLDRTIGEFLEFARPRELRIRAADVAELARDTVLLLRHSDEVHAGHELHGPPPGPVVAAVDPDAVRQVLWNLCKNALRAMPDGGRLDVEVRGEDSEALLAVADTGRGMSDSVKARAFQPLVSEFQGGMGLGLAIVYRIVKDHGGRVQIDSRAGQGTRVEVRLPRDAAAVPRRADAGSLT